MNPGQALEDATCLQVLQIMRQLSGLDLDAVAEAMGRNRQTVGCWFGESSPDKCIPLPLLPRFCHVVGSTIILEWLAVQYERLSRQEPEAGWNGDPEQAADLLVRGLVQAANALVLVRGMGTALSPAQGRQVSEAVLLAVASLTAAAREARGGHRGVLRHLRFARAQAPRQPGFRHRLRRALDWLLRMGKRT